MKEYIQISQEEYARLIRTNERLELVKHYIRTQVYIDRHILEMMSGAKEGEQV